MHYRFTIVLIITKNAAQYTIYFKITYSNPNKDVINMLDTQRKKEVA